MMKKMMNVLVYFFTPEDSARPTSGGGDVTFTIGTDNLNIGSVKALFWVGLTSGFFYLLAQL